MIPDPGVGNEIGDGQSEAYYNCQKLNISAKTQDWIAVECFEGQCAVFRPPALRALSGNFTGGDRPKTSKSSPTDYTKMAIGRSGLFRLQLVDLFMELGEEAVGTPAEMDQG